MKHGVDPAAHPSPWGLNPSYQARTLPQGSSLSTFKPSVGVCGVPGNVGLNFNYPNYNLLIKLGK